MQLIMATPFYLCYLSSLKLCLVSKKNLVDIKVVWFNFISLYFRVWQCMIMSLRQRERKFKPRIKMNHSIYKNLRKKTAFRGMFIGERLIALK